MLSISFTISFSLPLPHHIPLLLQLSVHLSIFYPFILFSCTISRHPSRPLPFSIYLTHSLVPFSFALRPSHFSNLPHLVPFSLSLSFSFTLILPLLSLSIAPKTIKMREEGNPLYDFLFAPESPNGLYYRWRTYGESISKR